MESLTLTSTRAEIDVADLPANVREVTVAGEIRLPVGTRMEDAEREIIRRTVEAYPTLKDAARVLGIGLRTLHTKLKRPGHPARRGPPVCRSGSAAAVLRLRECRNGTPGRLSRAGDSAESAHSATCPRSDAGQSARK